MNLTDGDIEHLIVRLQRPMYMYHFAVGVTDRVDLGQPHSYSDKHIAACRTKKQSAINMVRELLEQLG